MAAGTVAQNATDANSNVIPLTTIFTPPSSCTSRWTYEGSFYNSISGGLLIQNVNPEPLDTACFPPEFDGSGRQTNAQVYSPGQCPVGYTAPAQYVNGATTTLVCCRSSFSYFSTLTEIDNYNPPSSQIFAGCISTYPKASGPTTVPCRSGDVGLSSATTVSGPISMWGQPIQVAFQQKDLSLFPATSTSAPPSSTSAQPSSSPTAPAAATSGLPRLPTLSPPPASGLSSGAKAGIGVSVALVGLVLVGIAAFFLLRRRRSRRADPSEEQPMAGYYGDGKEENTPYVDEGRKFAPPDAMELDSSAGGAELDSNARMELPERRDEQIAELESTDHLPRRPSAESK